MLKKIYTAQEDVEMRLDLNEQVNKAIHIAACILNENVLREFKSSPRTTMYAGENFMILIDTLETVEMRKPVRFISHHQAKFKNRGDIEKLAHDVGDKVLTFDNKLRLLADLYRVGDELVWRLKAKAEQESRKNGQVVPVTFPADRKGVASPFQEFISAIYKQSHPDGGPIEYRIGYIFYKAPTTDSPAQAYYAEDMKSYLPGFKQVSSGISHTLYESEFTQYADMALRNLSMYPVGF